MNSFTLTGGITTRGIHLSALEAAVKNPLSFNTESLAIVIAPILNTSHVLAKPPKFGILSTKLATITTSRRFLVLL